MCLKRIIRFFGRVVGGILRYVWEKGERIVFWLAIACFYLLGIILAFLGNVIVLGLGAVAAFLVYALKGFAWFTYHFMCSTKWISGKVSEYTETFFDGIASTFKQEEENLDREIRLIIKTENL